MDYWKGIPCTECLSHTVYLAHWNSKGEAKGRSGHKKESSEKSGRKERGHEGVLSPKQSLTSTEDLTIELLGDANPTTIDQTS